MAHFEDAESNVREAVAEMMRELASVEGVSIYKTVKSSLLKIIEDNFKVEEAPQNTGDVVKASILREKRVLKEKLAGLKKSVDTWKKLFTAFKTIEKIIRGLGKNFESELNDDLFKLIEKLTKHINRFVREATQNMYEAVLLSIEKKEVFLKFGDEIAKQLRMGNTDNWSQVRMAASVGART
eukprot:UN25588